MRLKYKNWAKNTDLNAFWARRARPVSLSLKFGALHACCPDPLAQMRCAAPEPAQGRLTDFHLVFLNLNHFNPIYFLKFTLDLCTQFIYTRI